VGKVLILDIQGSQRAGGSGSSNDSRSGLGDRASSDYTLDFEAEGNRRNLENVAAPATMGAYEANPLSALLIDSYELSRNNSFA
jgi:hypothetical protein